MWRKEQNTMALNEREMFDRLETALKVYYQTNEIPPGGQIQLDLFFNWMYNQYGLVRKGVENGKANDL